jgi:hypothetical protein
VRGNVADLEAKRGPLEGLHEIADDPEYLAELSAVAGARGASANSNDSLDPSETDHSIGAASPGNADGVAAGARGGMSASARTVLRHSAQAGDEPHGFLACLRRGEPVPPAELAELAQALNALEIELRSTSAIDRRLTFALHRLAFESQILHTDAWPGVFDVWTVDMLRAVQEAVERILSGQDIRYHSAGSTPAAPFEPRPENPR